VQYDVHKDPHKNIALPDSLLSRFDLLFIVTDDVDERRDRMISDHVLRMHRYLQPGVEEGTPTQDSLAQPLSIDNPAAETLTIPTETSPFEKFDPLLHGGVVTSSGRSSTKKREVLSIPFVKKYIQYAKARPAPGLTKGAADWIVAAYSNFRNDTADDPSKKRTSPLTARTLETLIRLSTAHAKARLSAKVQERDAMAAEEIMRFALFKEVVKRHKRKKRKLNNGAGARRGDDDEDESEAVEEDSGDETGGEELNKESRTPEAATVPPGGKQQRAKDVDSVLDDARQDLEAMVVDERNDDGGLPAPRMQLFRSRVAGLFSNKLADEDAVPFQALLEMVNEGLATQHLFSTGEATLALEAMTEANDLMLSEGIVYKI